MLVYQALELDLMKFLSALCNGHELQIVRPHVVGAGANDLVVRCSMVCAAQRLVRGITNIGVSMMGLVLTALAPWRGAERVGRGFCARAPQGDELDVLFVVDKADLVGAKSLCHGGVAAD